MTNPNPTVYHVALVRSSCHWPAPRCKVDTVEVYLERDVDYLPSDIWQYLGQRETTKAGYKARRGELVAWINRTYGTNFTRAVIK